MDAIHDYPLNDREVSILRAIVYDYILTGKPVGSRSFVQNYSLSISPATIRNIMSDLERMGFLMQPHTSSGRVPTDQGYRFYVNSLLDSYDLNIQDEISINEEKIRRELQIDKIYTLIAKMLSSVSKYAGVMLSPRPDYTVVKRIELVTLDNNEILFILVTRSGVIINKRVVISMNVTVDHLHDYSQYLTGELCGYTLRELKASIIDALRGEKMTGFDNNVALDIAELALGGEEEPELYIEGIENLLKIPEMVEEDRLNSLLKIIEEKNILKEIMEKTLEEDGIKTYIGTEIDNPDVSGCSMVSATYKMGNSMVGAVGVFGPTRMDYEKVVPLVDYTGRVVSDFLTKMSK